MATDNEIYATLKEKNPDASETQLLQGVTEYQQMQRQSGTPQTKGAIDAIYGAAQKGLDYVRDKASKVSIPGMSPVPAHTWAPIDPADKRTPAEIQAAGENRPASGLGGLVPSDPTQALAMSVGGPIGRVVKGAGALPTALRIGAPVAVGMGSGAVDPRSSVAKGGFEGALPGAIESVARTARAGKNAVARIGTSARAAVDAEKVATDTITGIVSDMMRESGGTINMGPAFAGAGNSSAKLAEFPARVSAPLRKGFENVEKKISDSVTEELNLPLLAQSDPTKAAGIIQEYIRTVQATGGDPAQLQALINLVSTNPQAVVSQALKANPELANYTAKEAMKALKDAAFNARQANPSTGGYATRQVDRGVHEEFTGALHTQAKRPDLGQSFDNVSKGYWLGKKLEKFVGDLAGSGFFKNPEVRGAGTAPAINPQAGRDFATSNQADFGRPQMPGTQGGMFQGQPTGSRDSVRDLAGGLFPSFTRFPGLGSGSVGVQIPRFRMQQRVGQQYPTGSKPPENAREIAAGILPLISPSVGVE